MRRGISERPESPYRFRDLAMALHRRWVENGTQHRRWRMHTCGDQRPHRVQISSVCIPGTSSANCRINTLAHVHRQLSPPFLTLASGPGSCHHIHQVPLSCPVSQSVPPVTERAKSQNDHHSPPERRTSPWRIHLVNWAALNEIQSSSKLLGCREARASTMRVTVLFEYLCKY